TCKMLGELEYQEFLPEDDLLQCEENKKSKNLGGRPKSLVWGTYAKQGKQVSDGHYEATCLYCNTFWHKGSPQNLEAHFANDCLKVPIEVKQLFLNRLAAKAENPSNKRRKFNNNGRTEQSQTRITDFHESSKLSPEKSHEIDRACLQTDYENLLPQAILTILRSRAFFDDVRALAFALHPIKKAILTLESQSCTLADCLLGLAQLGAAIKTLPENDYCVFVVNPLQYSINPFDVELGDTEFLTTWWISIEDSFPEGEDYLVQLALKLLSITPHAAGCERVWSNLGWLYGKRRNRLGLNKIESMHKLSAYYHAHAKQELPYYGIEKTNEEIPRIFDKEDDLIISKELNLDANAFIKDLDEIIEDSDNIGMEEENIQDIVISENESSIEWDPDTEADKIIDDM
ncbi:5049_t:CDS:2, partial [Rhizophagus irregularis]